MNAVGAYNKTSDGRTHVCNCIGCCRICGQCRTAPWHARTCAQIAKLNAERKWIIKGGNGATLRGSAKRLSTQHDASRSR